MFQKKETFEFANKDLYRKLCGIGDTGIPALERKLELHIIPRGNSFHLEGDESKVDFALQFFQKLEKNFLERPDKDEYDTFDFSYMLKEAQNPVEKGNGSTGWKPKDKVITTYRGKPVYPRTRRQEAYVRSLQENLLTFAIGPAGTGKTFLSVALACKMIQTGQVERIILTRPAVEAGESLGFLPGDLNQKVDPYLRPVYDALYECIGFEKSQEFIALSKIEIAPVAFMRGRTLSNAFIILDEAQNCTSSQLKMILTRLGRSSRMCISGDISQIDLEHGKSGLEKVVALFQDTENIGTIFFGKEDITRHPLVEIIVRKFEEL